MRCEISGNGNLDGLGNVPEHQLRDFNVVVGTAGIEPGANADGAIVDGYGALDGSGPFYPMYVQLAGGSYVINAVS